MYHAHVLPHHSIHQASHLSGTASLASQIVPRSWAEWLASGELADQRDNGGVIYTLYTERVHDMSD